MQLLGHLNVIKAINAFVEGLSQQFEIFHEIPACRLLMSLRELNFLFLLMPIF